MTKIIALDMDGTLLFNHSYVSERNKQALKKAADMGIEIVGATGRPFNALTPDFLSLPGVRYVISSNGAVVWDLKTKSYIRRAYLSKEQTILILNNIGDMKEREVWLEVCVDGKSFAPNYQFDNIPRYTNDSMLQTYFKTTRYPTDDIFKFVLDSEDAIERVSCFSEDLEFLLKLKKDVLKVPDITITQAQPRDLEIGHLESSKGKALKYLAEYLNVDSNEVIAMGDGHNDMDMIEYAGIGVAMGNAHDDVKEMADYVTGMCENDGVADALEKFILNNN